MLDQNKKEILENNYVLNKRKDAKTKSTFRLIKKRCFLIGILFGFVLLCALYLISDLSNIYRISVDGNVYLKDEDIIELSELNDSSKFLLTIPKKIETKLTSSPYIEEAKVSLLDDRVVNITVKEVKQVGYIFEDGTSNILLINGDRVLLDENNYYLIEKIPAILGYNKEQLNEVLRGFKLIDYETINEISEIHRYPFTYDENMMEVIMRDGNFCFVSWTGLNMLDEYYRIVSGIDTSMGKSCIYLDELTNSGYTSVCPWQEVKKQDNSSEGDSL